MNFIINISSISTLLPLGLYLFFKFKSKDKALRAIFFYLLFSVTTDFIVWYLSTISSSQYGPNLINSLFTVEEFSFFCMFYYFAVFDNKIKKIIKPLWSLFFIFACGDFFLVNKMHSFDSINVGIEAIFIILMCIYYLIIQIRGSNNLLVYSTSNFWIIITFLIYISGTFFLYIMAEKYMSNKVFRIQYSIINSLFNMLKNILFSIAIFMKPTLIPSKSQKNKDWDDLLSFKIKK